MVGLKACRATINAAIGLLGLAGLAGLVLSFFDRTALLTVSVALMGLLALYAAFSLYYARQ